MMRAPARALPLLLLASLSSNACVEDRLIVDINTVIHGDGSCTRHVLYKLERTSDDGGDPADLSLDQDPLRLLHRYPTGDPWTVQQDVKARSHTVTLDGRFPSANEIGWDYWRAANPKAAPARNHFSFAMDGDDTNTRYEYSETFIDPASPLQGFRLLAQLLSQREEAFARQLGGQLDGMALRRREVVRAFHDTVTVPFVTEVSRLSSGPVFGPREKAELASILDRLDPLSEAFVERLLPLAPGLTPERAKKAIDGAFEATFGDSLSADLAAAGLPLPFFGSDNPAHAIHFHVTLVMPAPIARANTCTQGDTATWEFDGDDIYGRGFEMWAVAGSR
jgi:hypothetical protein